MSVLDHAGNLAQVEGRFRVVGWARCRSAVRGIRAIQVRSGDCMTAVAQLRRWSANRRGSQLGPRAWRCRRGARRVTCRPASGGIVRYRLL